jgi:hypothetical protein
MGIEKSESYSESEEEEEEEEKIDSRPIQYTIIDNEIIQTQGPLIEGTDPVARMFNNHLSRIKD